MCSVWGGISCNHNSELLEEETVINKENDEWTDQAIDPENYYINEEDKEER
jgi:hypothetical protein